MPTDDEIKQVLIGKSMHRAPSLANLRRAVLDRIGHAHDVYIDDDPSSAEVYISVYARGRDITPDEQDVIAECVACLVPIPCSATIRIVQFEIAQAAESVYRLGGIDALVNFLKARQ